MVKYDPCEFHLLFSHLATLHNVRFSHAKNKLHQVYSRKRKKKKRKDIQLEAFPSSRVCVRNRIVLVLAASWHLKKRTLVVCF